MKVLVWQTPRPDARFFAIAKAHGADKHYDTGPFFEVRADAERWCEAFLVIHPLGITAVCDVAACAFLERRDSESPS